MIRQAFLVGFAAFAASCASVSPRSTIEDRFVDLGLSPNRAACLADDLGDRLERDDLKATADFLTNLNDAGSAGGALDALLGIDNPRIAAAIARASVSCAFDRN